MFAYKKQIDNILVWIDKDSSLNKLININEINDEEYNTMMIDDRYDESDILKAQRYKDKMLSTDNDLELTELLEEDAYTDNAKRYFGLDIKEEE